MIRIVNYASDGVGSIFCSGSEPEQSEFMLDGERCGICMEVIVDQGVLDCCNGRFCFVCIDNWATITTTCPLCQGEIQMITCVPVKEYDTTGTKEEDTNLFIRDGDWHVEGRSGNIISFPSCYIDENAVTCMDGDDCKLRGGLGLDTLQDQSNLDTSIACDSCDIWYHAFCVEFDPDDTSKLTWLCPRCAVVYDGHQPPSKKTVSQARNPVDEDDECYVDSSFPGKLSVSLAGVGETAVVVSLVDDDSTVPGPTGIVPFSSADGVRFPDSASRVLGSEERHSISGSQEAPSTSNSFGTCDIAMETPDTPDGDGFSPVRTCSTKFYSDGFNVGNSPTDESNTVHLAFSAPGEENIEPLGGAEFKVIGERTEEGVFDEPSLAVEKSEQPFVKQVCDSPDVQRNCESNSYEDGPTKDVAEKAPPKSKTLIFKQKDVIRKPTVEGVRPRKNDITDDIMSIVRGTGRRLKNIPTAKDTPSRPRVKKIMRASAGDDGSSSIIHKLRNDIREAACNKSSDDPRKNLNGTKLLDALKTAIVGPTSATTKRLPFRPASAADGKERRLIGKEKMRRTDGGRERRICFGVTKLEKIEMLKSVLYNLRNGCGVGGKVKGESGSNRDDMILSRLYLADTSVVPRKDDIKPFFVAKRFPAELEEKEAKNPSRGSVVSSRGNSIAGSITQRGNNIKPVTDRSDKRRWALEVLARKRGAVGGGNEPRDSQDVLLKSNYPLLAQLPSDMRPIITLDRHCKIPLSIRQAQLYRMTEHFLKFLNPPSVRRTAATELAVADAMNIENTLARTSNCKSVYLNLCSRELLRHSVRPKNSVPAPPSVEVALRSAGFISDSPPTSPDRGTYMAEGGSSPNRDTDVVDEGAVSVIETTGPDPEPELNIYRDFDYDLGDEDYIGAGSVKVAGGAEAKMKVVLSVLNESVKLRNGPSDGVSVELGERAVGSFHERGSAGEEDCLRKEFLELYGPDEDPLAEQEEDVDGSGKGETGNPNPAGVSLGSTAEAPPTSPCHSETAESIPAAASKKKKKEKGETLKNHEVPCSSVYDKVKAYVKEHIRPLWRSGVITGEQYKWAARKTTEKVMRYHGKDKDATFLVKEGPKVRKLAERYVEANHPP